MTLSTPTPLGCWRARWVFVSRGLGGCVETNRTSRCDDRKPAPAGAGTSRFDGGIEREDIRLRRWIRSNQASFISWVRWTDQFHGIDCIANDRIPFEVPLAQALGVHDSSILGGALHLL